MALPRLPVAIAILLCAAGVASAQTFKPTPQQTPQSQGFQPPASNQPPADFGAPPQPQANFDGPAGQPFGPPMGTQSFSPSQPRAAQKEPPCFKEFVVLREDTEKKGKALQAAGQRKVNPQEACKLFNALVASEVKLTKYVEKNSGTCGIPAEVLTSLKGQHDQINQVRTRVCQVAAAGPQRPAAPTLSDALGTSRLPDSSNVKSGRGTFDTLTGTPLGR